MFHVKQFSSGKPGTRQVFHVEHTHGLRCKGAAGLSLVDPIKITQMISQWAPKPRIRVAVAVWWEWSMAVVRGREFLG